MFCVVLCCGVFRQTGFRGCGCGCALRWSDQRMHMHMHITITDLPYSVIYYTLLTSSLVTSIYVWKYVIYIHPYINKVEQSNILCI